MTVRSIFELFEKEKIKISIKRLNIFGIVDLEINN